MLDLVITTADTAIADLHVGGIISDHALICFNFASRRRLKQCAHVVQSVATI